MTKIIQKLLSHSIEEILYVINQNAERKVTLKKLIKFLEENEIGYLEEDLVQILNEFRVDKQLEISGDKFYQYFSREVWKLPIKQ